MGPSVVVAVALASLTYAWTPHPPRCMLWTGALHRYVTAVPFPGPSSSESAAVPLAVQAVLPPDLSFDGRLLRHCQGNNIQDLNISAPAVTYEALNAMPNLRRLRLSANLKASGSLSDSHIEDIVAVLPTSKDPMLVFDGFRTLRRLTIYVSDHAKRPFECVVFGKLPDIQAIQFIGATLNSAHRPPRGLVQLRKAQRGHDLAITVNGQPYDPSTGVLPNFVTGVCIGVAVLAGARETMARRKVRPTATTSKRSLPLTKALLYGTLALGAAYPLWDRLRHKPSAAQASTQAPTSFHVQARSPTLVSYVAIPVIILMLAVSALVCFRMRRSTTKAFWERNPDLAETIDRFARAQNIYQQQPAHKQELS